MFVARKLAERLGRSNRTCFIVAGPIQGLTQSDSSTAEADEAMTDPIKAKGAILTQTFDHLEEADEEISHTGHTRAPRLLWL
jgi:hypothetical protein